MKKTKSEKPKSEKPKSEIYFNLDSKDLVRAIDQVLAIVPVSPQSYYQLKVNENGIILSAIKDDTYCRYNIQGSAYRKAKVSLSDDGLSQLKTLVKNRGMLDFILTGSELAFNSGRYSGNLRVLDSIPATATEGLERFGKIKLSREEMLSMKEGFFSTVNQAVSATRIVNSFFDGFVSTALVEYSNNKLTVLTFDDWHIHHFEAKLKSKTPDIRITIPTAIFGTLEKVVKGENAHMLVNSSIFAIQTSEMFIVLPPMQDIDADAYVEFMKNLPKTVCSVDCTVELGYCLENISGLIKQEGSKRLELVINKKSGSLSYSNSNGRVSDIFSVKNFKGTETKLGLDYPIFSDTFKAIKNTGKFELNIHANAEGTPSLYSMKGEMLGGTLTIMGHVSE